MNSSGDEDEDDQQTAVTAEGGLGSTAVDDTVVILRGAVGHAVMINHAIAVRVADATPGTAVAARKIPE